MAFSLRGSVIVCLFVGMLFGVTSCTTAYMTPPQTPSQQRGTADSGSNENEERASEASAGSASTDIERTRTRPEGIDSALVPEIVPLLNAARQQSQQCGDETYPPVQPLLWDDALGYAALDHGEDIAFHIIRGHVGSDGSQLRDRVHRYGNYFGRLGETIALGTTTPERALQRLLRSDAHCRILMTTEHNRLGAAWSENRHGYPYYVLVLGRAY